MQNAPTQTNTYPHPYPHLHMPQGWPNTLVGLGRGVEKLVAAAAVVVVVVVLVVVTVGLEGGLEVGLARRMRAGPSICGGGHKPRIAVGICH